MTTAPSLRRLGQSDLEVHPLCLGGNVFGWTADERQSFEVMDAYAEAGGNFIDTADVYAANGPGHEGGDSERIIGAWLRSRRLREHFVVATKVGGFGGLSATNVRDRVESSLRRLELDRIDLLYAHVDDADTPLQETIGAFGELVERGLVGHVAAANYSAERLREAVQVARQCGHSPFIALSTQYNLLERRALRHDRFGIGGFEGPMREFCLREGIACLPYWVLAQGLLTGKYRPDLAQKDEGLSARGAAVQSGVHIDRRGAAVLTILAEIARVNEVPIAAVTTAWTAQQPGVLGPIVSARTVAQLKDLFAFSQVSFTEDDLQALDAATQPNRGHS